MKLSTDAPEINTSIVAVKNAMAELRAATKKQIGDWGNKANYQKGSYPIGFLEALDWVLTATDKYMKLDETK